MPHVMGLSSYTRDTLDLLKKIEGMVFPPDALLMTLDVESLYLSIPQEQGVGKVCTVLYEEPHTKWNYNEFILTLLQFVLTHNWFGFKGSYYLQVQGVAMGTGWAPAYTNLYLGGWEWHIFSDGELSMYTDQVMCWMRYIDDIFLIWMGTPAMLIAFVETLNRNSFNLRFTLNSSMERITFLDLSIYKDEDNCLSTSLYRKETLCCMQQVLILQP